MGKSRFLQKNIELKEETPTGKAARKGLGAGAVVLAFVSMAFLVGFWKLFRFSSGNRP